MEIWNKVKGIKEKLDSLHISILKCGVVHTGPCV